MRAIIYRFMACGLLVGLIACCLSAQTSPKAKKPKAKAEPADLNPFGRPEGSIVDQSARYYVWYDDEQWHLRTTSKAGRNFNGTIRLKDARIKSWLPVGLKKDRQKQGDAFRVNDERNELKFKFITAQLSDGFDLTVDGEEGQIEFELLIDTQKNPRAIFVGRALGHPNSNPFTLPAMPKRTKE
jgi:hypothetical protein